MTPKIEQTAAVPDGGLLDGGLFEPRERFPHGERIERSPSPKSVPRCGTALYVGGSVPTLRSRGAGTEGPRGGSGQDLQKCVEQPPRPGLAAELRRLLNETGAMARIMAERDPLIAGIAERWRGELAALLRLEALP